MNEVKKEILHTHLLSPQESEFRPGKPVHVASIQERAETLAAKFTGLSNKPDKPQVEKYNDGLTKYLLLISHFTLHGLHWFLFSVNDSSICLTQP